MRNDWGFLTIPLSLQSGDPISPEQAQLPLTVSFSNGNTMVRDAWDGDTILAIQAGNSNGCYAPGHLQGDLNSFLLSYKNERLLVDAGHSCYRNIIHGLESATQTHNTCSFLLQQDKMGLQEDLAKIKLLEQNNVLRRRIISNGEAGKPVDRGGSLLHIQRFDAISVVSSEVGSVYGYPITLFKRHWIQLDAQVTIVIDQIKASEPVKTVWNWMLNNRDFKTIVETTTNTLIATRNKIALKLINTGNAFMQGPVYAHMHDAYHVLPNQLGEGASGSSLIYRTTAAKNEMDIFNAHICITDDEMNIGKWHYIKNDNGFSLEREEKQYSVNWIMQEPLQLEIQAGNEFVSFKEGMKGNAVMKI
jgi:hypothetical protein